jgi:hypothetical protein
VAKLELSRKSNRGKEEGGFLIQSVRKNGDEVGNINEADLDKALGGK